MNRLLLRRRLQRVRRLQSQGQWERSISAARGDLERTPAVDDPNAASSLELAWRLALAAAAVGDDDLRDRALAVATGLGATRSAWRRALADALEPVDPAVAAGVYGTLSGLEPTVRRWPASAGRASVAHEDWDGATQAWMRMIALEPTKPEHYYRLARAQIGAADLAAARETLRAGLVHDPEHHPVDDFLVDGTPKSFRKRRAVARFVEDNLEDLQARVAALPAPSAATMEAPRHLFVYWKQGFDSAPPIVQRCLAQLRELHGADVLVPLDDSNVGEWLDVPADVRAIASKTPTQYSDLLRAGLLAKHGGMWIDATCLATEPLNAVEDARTPSGLFSFRYRPYRIASWFMAAEPGDYVMASLYELMLTYWRTHDHVISYFMFHDMLETLCFFDPRFAAEFDTAPVVRPNRQMKWRMGDEYDPESFAALVSLSFVHKMTYKQPASVTAPGTIYSHVLEHGTAITPA